MTLTITSSLQDNESELEPEECDHGRGHRYGKKLSRFLNERSSLANHFISAKLHICYHNQKSPLSHLRLDMRRVIMYETSR